MKLHHALSASALIMVTGCSDAAAPGTYAVPVEQAYASLVNADTTEFRDRWQCGILIHFRTEAVTNDHITWRVTSSGQDVASFTARFIADGPDRTRVEIDVPSTPDGGEIYDGTKLYPRPAFRQPLREGVAEFIASQLGGRAFSIEGMPNLSVNDPCFMQKEMLRNGDRLRVNDPSAGLDRSSTYTDGDDLGDDWGSGI
jgi:hypothetical protein